MSEHSRPRRHVWMMALLGALLVAAHGMIFYYVSSHVTISAGLVSGVIALIVVKHLGLVGPAFALLRRLRRKR